MKRSLSALALTPVLGLGTLAFGAASPAIAAGPDAASHREVVAIAADAASDPEIVDVADLAEGQSRQVSVGNRVMTITRTAEGLEVSSGDDSTKVLIAAGHDLPPLPAGAPATRVIVEKRAGKDGTQSYAYVTSDALDEAQLTERVHEILAESDAMRDGATVLVAPGHDGKEGRKVKVIRIHEDGDTTTTDADGKVKHEKRVIIIHDGDGKAAAEHDGDGR